MPIFSYQGRDATGKLIKGESTATSADTLSATLIKDHIFPITITEKKKIKPNHHLKKSIYSSAKK